LKEKALMVYQFLRGGEGVEFMVFIILFALNYLAKKQNRLKLLPRWEMVRNASRDPLGVVH
jgi:hypothetical protein